MINSRLDSGIITHSNKFVSNAKELTDLGFKVHGDYEVGFQTLLKTLYTQSLTGEYEQFALTLLNTNQNIGSLLELHEMLLKYEQNRSNKLLKSTTNESTANSVNYKRFKPNNNNFNNNLTGNLTENNSNNYTNDYYHNNDSNKDSFNTSNNNNNYPKNSSNKNKKNFNNLNSQPTQNNKKSKKKNYKNKRKDNNSNDNSQKRSSIFTLTINSVDNTHSCNNKDVIYVKLDSQCYLNIVMNKKLLQNIQNLPKDQWIEVIGFNGKSTIKQFGYSNLFGKVYYDPEGSANLLSLKYVSSTYNTTFDNVNQMFIVTISDNEKLYFKSVNGMDYVWEYNPNNTITNNDTNIIAEIDATSIDKTKHLTMIHQMFGCMTITTLKAKLREGSITNLNIPNKDIDDIYAKICE
jgi:hypothetical protein